MHQGDKDEAVFQFLAHFSNCIETEENKGILPLQFLIDFSETLGFKPYFESDKAIYFNLDAGVFQTSTNAHERILMGQGVNLIADLIKHGEVSERATKNTREEALDIMLEYYKIHIPRFDNLETFDVVKEILSA